MRGDDGDIDEDDKEDEEVEGQEEIKEEETVTRDADESSDDDEDFQPKRPVDHLPERTAYEALCRGDADVVAVIINTLFVVLGVDIEIPPSQLLPCTLCFVYL